MIYWIFNIIWYIYIVHITLHIIHIVCRIYIYTYIFYCTLHINFKILDNYQISIIIHYYFRKMSTFQKSNVKPFRPRDLETCAFLPAVEFPPNGTADEPQDFDPKLAWDINSSKPHRLRPHQPVTVHFIPWSCQEPVYWRCLP